MYLVEGAKISKATMITTERIHASDPSVRSNTRIIEMNSIIEGPKEDNHTRNYKEKRRTRSMCSLKYISHWAINFDTWGNSIKATGLIGIYHRRSQRP